MAEAEPICSKAAPGTYLNLIISHWKIVLMKLPNYVAKQSKHYFNATSKLIIKPGFTTLYLFFYHRFVSIIIWLKLFLYMSSAINTYINTILHNWLRTIVKVLKSTLKKCVEELRLMLSSIFFQQKTVLYKSLQLSIQHSLTFKIISFKSWIIWSSIFFQIFVSFSTLSTWSALTTFGAP